MAEKIIEKNSTKQLTEDYTRYGIYIMYRRVLSDYRDGLKPVQRRILWAMFNDSKAINQNVKSASVVGKVMEKYHPHGDSSIYNTMIPLANWFETKVPLIKGKGNFGTFQGDPYAASRYTECRLSEFALEAVLGDAKTSKEAVDWTPNYDDKYLEPEFLPCAVPLLLVNGSFGIGLGIKAEIPSHNLSEVIDATLKLINDPNVNITLIPDTCMNTEIYMTDFDEISQKGYGHFKVRGIIDIEDYKGKPALVIKSVPDTTYLDEITDKIESLVESKKIIQIENSFDESNVSNMRYVITLKPGADPNFVRDVIYKNTEMEKNVRINFETLDGLTPMRMSYRSYLLSFIEFRKMTKFRAYANQLQMVQTKIHEKEAYIRVLESGEVDNIIANIRKRKTIDDNGENEALIKKLGITDLQAKYILGSDIRKLSIGYLNKYKQEAKDYAKVKDMLMTKLTDDNLILKDIIDELVYFKNKYSTPRKAKIIKDTNSIDNLVPKGAMTVILTEKNFLKKIPYGSTLYSLKGDSPKIMINVDNTESILVFDAMGKVFKLPVHKISFTDKNSNGTDARFLVKGLTASISTIIRENDLMFLSKTKRKKNNYFLCVLSHMGYIKRMDMEDFGNISLSGLTYSKLEDGDYVKDIQIISEKDRVIIYSDRKSIMMNGSDIPYLKRNTRGNKTINSELGADGIQKIDCETDPSTSLLTITQNGHINSVPVSTLPNLGNAGNKKKYVPTLIRLSKTDKIVSVLLAKPTDTIRVFTTNNMYEFIVSEIPIGNSISTGDKMIPIKGDKIMSACRIESGK